MKQIGQRNVAVMEGEFDEKTGGRFGTFMSLPEPADVATKGFRETKSRISFKCYAVLRGRGRSSETESDRPLLESVRDYRFELPQVRILVYLDDPEIVDVGLGGNPLHIVRLDVLNKDHILSVVVQPANEDKLAEDTSLRLQSCLGGLRRRRGSLRSCRNSRCDWIGTGSGFLIRILHNCSLLPHCAGRDVAAIDVPSVSIHRARIACVDHYDDRTMVDSAPE